MRIMIDVDLKLSKHYQSLHEAGLHDYDDYYLEHLKELLAEEAELHLRSKSDMFIAKAFTEVREIMDEMAREEAIGQGA